MAEATWGDANAPSIDWHISAAIENVRRGDEDVPEVTNLAAAVRAWQALDRAAQEHAMLSLERPVHLNEGAPLDRFVGAAIGDLARHLSD